MKNNTLYLLTILCILALTGCRKELLYPDTQNDSFTMNVDWSQLPAAYKKPHGIAVTFIKLPEPSKGLTYNLPADGGTKGIKEGDYNILMTNNDYESVLMRNTNKWDDIEAYTSDMTHEAYEVAPSNQPSMTESTSRTGISVADLLMVSSEHKNIAIKSLKDGESQGIVFKPKNLTIPVILRIPVEGVQYISQARGFLSGVSPSVKLVSGVKSQSPANVLFDYGSALGGKELRTSFSIFGLVDGNAVSDSYKLGLEMLLIDGSVLYYDFEVNSMITDPIRLTGGEIKITEPITIDPVEPPFTGEGFRPSIGEWGDEEIIIPIG